MSLASTYPSFNIDAVRYLAAQDHQSYRTITPPDARVLLASVEAALAAANARADAVDRRSRTYEAANGKLVTERNQLAQKLEEAERGHRAATRVSVDVIHERDQLAQKLEEAERDAKQWRIDTLAAEAHARSLKAERDQLAARVTELEYELRVTEDLRDADRDYLGDDI